MVVGASRGVFVSTNRGGRAAHFPPLLALMFLATVVNLDGVDDRVRHRGRLRDLRGHQPVS